MGKDFFFITWPSNWISRVFLAGSQLASLRPNPAPLGSLSQSFQPGHAWPWRCSGSAGGRWRSRKVCAAAWDTGGAAELVLATFAHSPPGAISLHPREAHYHLQSFEVSSFFWWGNKMYLTFQT